MNTYAGLLALLLGVLSGGPVGADPEPDPAAAMYKLAIQRRDAARKTYEVMWTNYRERFVSGEIVYRWSKRWLNAEKQLSEKQADQIAACEGHRERMRELERLIRKLQQSGLTTTDEVSATEYYRVEAEIWLLQAKEKKNR